MEFVVTCLPGLGPLLADELTELGISVTDPGNAHVGIQGLQQDALRACLWSRLAERVLVPLAVSHHAPTPCHWALAMCKTLVRLQDWCV